MQRSDSANAVAARYWEVVFREVDDHGHIFYVALHPELEGCVAQGATPDEAVASLEGARELYLRVLRQQGIPVPEPDVLRAGEAQRSTKRIELSPAARSASHPDVNKPLEPVVSFAPAAELARVA
jgi:predicted RNase H-like HicB family nuclease